MNTQGFTVWLTGLPASGKSEVALALAELVRRKGVPVEVINSGRMRQTPLGASLGFSRDDRDTNVRRHAFAARLLARNGVCAIVSAVSPYRATRDSIRKELGTYVEVHVSTPRAACIERDRSGNWARALQGEIRGFTGVDDPYESPTGHEVTVDLSDQTAQAAALEVFNVLGTLGHLPDTTVDLVGEDQDLLDADLKEVKA